MAPLCPFVSRAIATVGIFTDDLIISDAAKTTLDILTLSDVLQFNCGV